MNLNKLWRRPQYLVAFDGEGIDRPNGQHDYVLLCAGDSEGNYYTLEHPDSYCSTEDCFKFLLMFSEASGGLIGFSLGYDFNMIITDLILTEPDPQKQKNLLHNFQHARWITWRDYRIKYIPRKIFWLRHIPTKTTVVVEDVFSFFQMSFVRALRAWNVIDDTKIIDTIEEMKQARGKLEDQPWEKVVGYCLSECNLLIRLYNKLLDAFEEASKGSIPIGLKGNYGPGAAAAYTLDHLQTERYITPPPDSVQLGFVERAYFGGRFDVCEVGYFPNIWQYDINSAYPYWITKLPCLRHGKWRNTDHYESDAPYAIYRVRWQLPFDFRWPIFPYRTRSGAIYYPIKGYGCYWAHEIKAALELLERWGKGSKIEIYNGVVYDQRCNCRPGAFINEMYTTRQEMVLAKNPAEKSYKLVYNSIYGKFAQRIAGATNKFQSFAWAGFITAGTRSQILEAITIGYEEIISVATDGVLSTKQLPLDVSTIKELGRWEEKNRGVVWVIMPGIYWFPKKEEIESRTRGHEARSINWKVLVTRWKAQYLYGGEYSYKTKRFVGAGSASMMIDHITKWRRWIERPIRVTFHPIRRRFEPEGSTIREQLHLRKMIRRYAKDTRAFWYPIGTIPNYDPLQTLSARYRKGSEDAKRYETDDISNSEQPD